MNRLVVGAALAALLLPSAAAAAPDTECSNVACSEEMVFADRGHAIGPNGWEGTEAPSFGRWGVDLEGRDPSVSAGDNFYRFANGLALDQLTIPADRVRYGSFDLLGQLSENRMKALIAGLVARTDLDPATDEGKIANLYRAYMDEAGIEALDDRPLQPFLAAIRAIDSHDAFAAHLGTLQGRFGGGFFGTGIGIDAKHPDRYVTYIGQDGIGLPSRDYYLDPRFADKKQKYQAYIAQMLEMIGWNDPAGSAAAIMEMEERIALVHWTVEESRDADKTYNAMSPSELAAMAPGFDWAGYLESAGLGDVERVVVGENTAFPKIAAIFAATPLDTLKAWQAFNTVDQAAPSLSRRFVDAQWRFRSNELAGQPQQRQRELRAISHVNGAMGQAIGRLYVAEYFPPDSKAKMDELVRNLLTAMGNRIRGLEWMSDETKAAALEKLSKFGVKIGYPDQWRDYGRLEIRPRDLAGNVERIGRFNWERNLLRLNGPVDRVEWTSMNPQTVNATYNSNLNQITFPAAILQPPFFDPDADPAVNYGGIGGAIGHEIGHGFDDQGSKSDGDGVLRDWWTAADRADFDARTARLGEQYAQFEALPGHHVRPGLTMGENIGDAAGVAVSLEAYHLSLGGRPAPVLDGLTGDQRFFLSWAQIWRAAYREDAIKNQVATDPHAPPMFRVIGPVRNVDAWYDAFGVQPGSTYYLPPEERVRLW